MYFTFCLVVLDFSVPGDLAVIRNRLFLVTLRVAGVDTRPVRITTGVPAKSVFLVTVS